MLFSRIFSAYHLLQVIRTVCEPRTLFSIPNQPTVRCCRKRFVCTFGEFRVDMRVRAPTRLITRLICNKQTFRQTDPSGCSRVRAQRRGGINPLINCGVFGGMIRRIRQGAARMKSSRHGMNPMYVMFSLAMPISKNRDSHISGNGNFMHNSFASHEMRLRAFNDALDAVCSSLLLKPLASLTRISTCSCKHATLLRKKIHKREKLPKLERIMKLVLKILWTQFGETP